MAIPIDYERSAFFERRFRPGALASSSQTRAAAFVFAIVTAALIAPKFLHTLLPLLFIFIYLDSSLYRRSLLDPRRRRWDACTIAFAVLGSYAFVRAASAPDAPRALAIVAAFACISAMTLQIVRRTAEIDERQRAGLNSAVVAAAFTGSIYLVVEFATGLAVVSKAVIAAPVLAGGNPMHFKYHDGAIETVRTYVLNRNVGVLNLVLWPALLIAASNARRPMTGAGAGTALALFTIAAIATFSSWHESSKVALLAAAVIFLASRFSMRLGRALVAAGWIGANLGALVAAEAAYDHGLQLNAMIPGSARARVVIWNYTARHVRDDIVFGKGVDSVRFNDKLEGPHAVRLPGELSDQRPGHHSHNVYLQIWYELGAAGVVLFALAGLAILQRLRRLEDAAQPFALAAFTSAATIAAFSWGLWQLWFFAGVCLGAILLTLASAPFQRREARRVPSAQPAVVVARDCPRHFAMNAAHPCTRGAAENTDAETAHVMRADRRRRDRRPRASSESRVRT